MDTLDGVIEAEQLDAAVHHFLPEMIDAGVVRKGRTFHIEVHTRNGVVTIDMTDRVRQAMTAARFGRSLERRRSLGRRPALMRRPRARGAGRPKAAPTRRAASAGSRDGPDDPEPAPAGAGLRYAPGAGS